MTHKRRNDYNMQLQRTAASVLQLPLRIVNGFDGNQRWEYSPDTMIEIASSQQASEITLSSQGI